MTDAKTALERYKNPETTWVGVDKDGNTLRLKPEVLAEANQRIAELEAERDAAMSLVEASTREGVIAESLKRAEQAEVEVAKLEADRDALKCCFTCDYYDEGFCLWCATPSNGLAAPVHPRCTTCRCTPARWTPREADHE